MNHKQQLAAMGEQLTAMGERMGVQVQPLCMAKRIEELEAQVRVMAGLLREARPYMDHRGGAGPKGYAQLSREIDAALAGKLPVPVVLEGWKLEALDNDCIVVRKDGVGFYVASFNAENIASTILHALASDMLAVAPKPEPKP